MHVFKRALQLVIHIALSILIALPSSALAREKHIQSGAALASVLPVSSGKNGKYEVFQEKGKGKQLKTRVLRRGDFREILVDQDEDGTADVWEVTRGSLTMKASRPYRGRFSQIEYTDRREKAAIKTTLIYNSRIKDYAILSTNIETYKEMNSEGSATPELCSETSEHAQFASFDQLLREIQERVGGTVESGLQCKLGRYQDAYFDLSCNVGDFKTSRQDMVDAMAKIMGSRESQPPKLLHCLEHNGFAYNSARIQERLAKPLQDLKTVGRNAFDNNCTQMTPLPSGVASKPLFSCKVSAKAAFGHWNAKTESVNFNAGSARMSAEYRMSPADSYTTLMFHELLHSTGLDSSEETLIRNLETCCAPTPGTAGQVEFACNSVRRRATDEQFLTQLERAPGMADFRVRLTDQLGSQAAKAFTDSWALGFRDSAEGGPALARFNQCKTTSTEAACWEQMRPTVATYSEAYIARECPLFRHTNSNKNNIDCDQIGNLFADTFKYRQPTVSPQVEVLEPPRSIEINTLPLNVPKLVVASNNERIESVGNIWNRYENANSTGLAARPAIEGSNLPPVAARTAAPAGAPPVGAAPAPAAAAPSRVAQAPAAAAPAAQPAAPPASRAETGGATIGFGAQPPAQQAPTAGSQAPVVAAAPANNYRTLGESTTKAGTSAPRVVSEYSSPVPMPPANLPASRVAPLGESDTTRGATPVVNALMNVGEKLTSQVVNTLASSANASVANAHSLVAMPEQRVPASAAPPVSNIMTAGTGGSSARGRVAMAAAPRGGPSGGSSGGGSSARSGGGGSRMENNSNGGSSDNQGAAPASAEPQSEDPQMAVAAAAPASAAPGVRMAGASAVAPSASQSWQSGTFRSSTDARRFLSTTPSSQVETLLRQPAFVEDLVRRRIGIRRSSGQFVGHSQPEIVYEECGARLVLRGTCR